MVPQLAWPPRALAASSPACPCRASRARTTAPSTRRGLTCSSRNPSPSSVHARYWRVGRPGTDLLQEKRQPLIGDRTVFEGGPAAGLAAQRPKEAAVLAKLGSLASRGGAGEQARGVLAGMQRQAGGLGDGPGQCFQNVRS